MSTKPDSLWLHSYSGRETGLMIVGSASALRALGQDLITAADSPPTSASPFPPQVATPAVTGPFKDRPDFTLSFHLPGSSPLTEVAPLRRQATPTPVFLAVAVCAVVGAITLLRWLVGYAL